MTRAPLASSRPPTATTRSRPPSSRSSCATAWSRSGWRRWRPFERTLDAERLEEEEAAAWCGVLNDARLVLAEQLGVTEELYERGISPRDPRAAELAYYGWLTWLQGELVEALASRL